MATKSGGGDSGGLNCWRDYFRTANSDVFDVIEHAIMVAASDYPKEFRLKRDKIAELLFSCRLTRCSGCDRVELGVSALDDEIKGIEFDDHGDDLSKGSKVNSTSRDENVKVGGDMEMMNMIINPNHESNFSYGDAAEALTDEIEEEREIVVEVLRIKEILLNSQDESDSALLDSLRRLQLMALNVDILKATEIGKAVNGIRKHNSKDIRYLARQLIDAWKIIVDEWVKATQEIAEEGTPDSVNPSTLDEEEGLPSPPLDEGAFFATQSMDFSQFFDGMDDDGNLRNNGEFDKSREVGRNESAIKQREEPRMKDNKVQKMRRQASLMKPNKPLNTQLGPDRPLKLNDELKLCKAQQKPEKPILQRRPASQTDKLRCSNEDSVQEKLETTKRKLQERYLQAENAKKQRTIQVMDIHELPKQGLVNKNINAKFGNPNNRNWANGRR